MIRERPDRPLKYEVRVYNGKNERGTSQYVTRSVGTLREAHKVEGELLDSVAAGIEPDVPANVNQLLDRYFADGDLRRPGEDMKVADNRIRPFLGRLKLVALTPVQIDRWTKMLAAKGWNGTPLSRDTVQRTLNILSGACTLGVRYGWLAANPCQRARKYATPPKDRAREYTPSFDVAMYALEHAQGQLKLIVRLALGTGARRGELAALRRSCFEGNVLTISESVWDKEGGAVLGATKNERVRSLVIDDELRAMLDAHFAEQAAAAAEHTFVMARDPFVFSPRPECSTFYRAESIRLMLNRLVMKKDKRGAWVHPQLAEPKLTPHCLRRLHATILTAAGVPLAAVKDRLGHAQQSTTERYIGKLSASDVEAAALIGKVLAGNT